jgi:hypothetical protein
MQFGVANTNPEQFRTYSVAGLRKVAGTNVDPTNRTEAQTKVIAPSTALPTTPDESVVGKLDSGLTTYRMWYNDAGSTQDIGAVGFMISFARFNYSTASAAQSLQIVPVTGTALGVNKLVTGQAINDNFASSVNTPSGGVFICFVSGTTNQSGLITIGGDSRDLALKLDIKYNKTCS